METNAPLDLADFTNLSNYDNLHAGQRPGRLVFSSSAGSLELFK